MGSMEDPVTSDGSAVLDDCLSETTIACSRDPYECIGETMLPVGGRAEGSSSAEVPHPQDAQAERQLGAVTTNGNTNLLMGVPLMDKC